MEHNINVIISEENGLFIDNEQRKVQVYLDINKTGKALDVRKAEKISKDLKPGIKIQRIELSRREKEILGFYGVEKKPKK